MGAIDGLYATIDFKINDSALKSLDTSLLKTEKNIDRLISKLNSISTNQKINTDSSIMPQSLVDNINLKKSKLRLDSQKNLNNLGKIDFSVLSNSIDSLLVKIKSLNSETKQLSSNLKDISKINISKEVQKANKNIDKEKKDSESGKTKKGKSVNAREYLRVTKSGINPNMILSVGRFLPQIAAITLITAAFVKLTNAAINFSKAQEKAFRDTQLTASMLNLQTSQILGLSDAYKITSKNADAYLSTAEKFRDIQAGLSLGEINQKDLITLNRIGAISAISSYLNNDLKGFSENLFNRYNDLQKQGDKQLVDLILTQFPNFIKSQQQITQTKEATGLTPTEIAKKLQIETYGADYVKRTEQLAKETERFKLATSELSAAFNKGLVNLAIDILPLVTKVIYKIRDLVNAINDSSFITSLRTVIELFSGTLPKEVTSFNARKVEMKPVLQPTISNYSLIPQAAKTYNTNSNVSNDSKSTINNNNNLNVQVHTNNASKDDIISAINESWEHVLQSTYKSCNPVGN